MKLKNIQLFETILSPKKQRLHWYRGINSDFVIEKMQLDIQDLNERWEKALAQVATTLDKEDVGVNYETGYGDGTPAQWFTTDLEFAITFGPLVAEVKLNPNLDLFNIFDDEDWNYYLEYCENHDEEPIDREELRRESYGGPFETDKGRHKHGGQGVFTDMQWDTLESVQSIIKDQGFDGIILQEHGNFNVEIFDNEFDLITIHTKPEAETLKDRRYYGNEGKPDFIRKVYLKTKQNQMKTRYLKKGLK